MHLKQIKPKSIFFFELILYTALFSTAAFAAARNATNAPSAFFPETRYEFTPVLEGIDVTHTFTVKNKGTSPLKIEKVRTG